MNYRNLVKVLILAVSCFVISFSAGNIYQDYADPVVGGAGSTGAQNILWRLTGGNLVPAISSWGIQLPSLTNEDCIGTDSNGVLQSGTCTGGGGSSEWTDNGTELEPNEGESIKVDYVTATSTTATSTFPLASTSELVVNNTFYSLGETISNWVTWFQDKLDNGYDAIFGTATSTLFATSGGDSDDWNTAFGWGDHSTQGYLQNIVEDTTPQLGGDLDAQNNELNNVNRIDLTGNGSGATYTSQASPFILHNTDLTFDVFGGSMPSILGVTGDYTFPQGTGAFAGGFIFNNSGTYTSGASGATTMGPVYGMNSQPTLTADTNTVQQFFNAEYLAQGIYRTVNGGTFSGLGLHAQFMANGIDVGSGATIAKVAGFYANEATVTGTLTRQAGLLVDNLTTATNNTGIVIGATSGAIPTGNYALYSYDTDDSYFAGNLGLGKTSPSYKLDVDSGTSNTIALFQATGVTNDPGLFIVGASGATRLRATTGETLSLGANNVNDHLFIDTDGDIGIGDTSPAYKLTVGNGDLFGVASDGSIDAITGISGATGTYDFTNATVKQQHYKTFTASSSALIQATSTIPLGTAFVGQTWNYIECYTNTGTADIRFGDGTNWMTFIQGASTTVARFPVSTNNTFTAGEKISVQASTTASGVIPSCTINYEDT